LTIPYLTEGLGVESSNLSAPTKNSVKRRRHTLPRIRVRAFSMWLESSSSVCHRLPCQLPHTLPCDLMESMWLGRAARLRLLLALSRPTGYVRYWSHSSRSVNGEVAPYGAIHSRLAFNSTWIKTSGGSSPIQLAASLWTNSEDGAVRLPARCVAWHDSSKCNLPAEVAFARRALILRRFATCCFGTLRP